MLGTEALDALGTRLGDCPSVFVSAESLAHSCKRMRQFTQFHGETVMDLSYNSCHVKGGSEQRSLQGAQKLSIVVFPVLVIDVIRCAERTILGVSPLWTFHPLSHSVVGRKVTMRTSHIIVLAQVLFQSFSSIGLNFLDYIISLQQPNVHSENVVLAVVSFVFSSRPQSEGQPAVIACPIVFDGGSHCKPFVA